MGPAHDHLTVVRNDCNCFHLPGRRAMLIDVNSCSCRQDLLYGRRSVTLICRHHKCVGWSSTRQLARSFMKWLCRCFNRERMRAGEPFKYTQIIRDTFGEQPPGSSELER